MADYKESEVTGTKWTRAIKVVVENQLGEIPKIIIVEEDVVNINGQKIHQLAGNLMCGFDSDNPLHVEIYTNLNQLYTILRTARDTGLPVDYSDVPVVV